MERDIERKTRTERGGQRKRQRERERERERERCRKRERERERDGGTEGIDGCVDASA